MEDYFEVLEVLCSTVFEVCEMAQKDVELHLDLVYCMLFSILLQEFVFKVCFVYIIK